MLRLDQLTLRQGAFLLEADFTLPKGELCAVIGPSGAGKSTLLSAISGFFAPASGRVEIAGQDVTHLPPGERPLSILFQDSNLFPHLSVSDNLGLGISPNLRLTPKDRASITEALEKVGLADKAARRPAELSGGEQSRVALARTLLRARPLLLLDEPFAALGPALKRRMLDLVGELARANGTTVLMVTHDPLDAERLCPLTILLADGRAYPPQPTKSLLENPPPSLRAYLGEG